MMGMHETLEKHTNIPIHSLRYMFINLEKCALNPFHCRMAISPNEKSMVFAMGKGGIRRVDLDNSGKVPKFTEISGLTPKQCIKTLPVISHIIWLIVLLTSSCVKRPSSCTDVLVLSLNI